jgi:hypothetical protein
VRLRGYGVVQPLWLNLVLLLLLLLPCTPCVGATRKGIAGGLGRQL